MVDYKKILQLSREGNSLRQVVARVGNSHHTGLCEEISVKTKTVIKTLLWSGMKNLPLLFIYSIQ